MPDMRKLISGEKTKLTRPQETVADHPAKLELQDGGFYRVPLVQIRPDPNQPRKYFDPEALEDLSQSVKERGVLQPILVRRDEQMDLFFVVAGERRFRAAAMAGLSEAPVIVTRGDPLEIALIENLQRDNLKPIEEAEAFDQMMRQYGYSQEQLAATVGKKQSTVSEILSLNKLPDSIKDEIRETNAYSKRTLVEVARQKTPRAMVALFRRINARELQSDEVREIARTQREPIQIIRARILDLEHRLERLDWRSVQASEREELLKTIDKIRQLFEMNQ